MQVVVASPSGLDPIFLVQVLAQAYRGCTVVLGQGEHVNGVPTGTILIEKKGRD